jgi:ribosome biogenesis GTPase
VIAQHRDRYIVAGEGGDWSAVLSGRLRHEAEAESLAEREHIPAVGDWVVAAPPEGDGSGTIRAVLPRRTAFTRKVAGDATAAQVVAANIDVALLATALPEDLNARRLERYLALAWESGAIPVVVLTKADLAADLASAIAEAATAAPGVDVVAVSAAMGSGLEQLDRFLAPGRTAVLLGSSGVGKSTLINRLLGAERLRTAAVRDDGKGRHTTTHRELVRLANGALLVDTPGMRELQLWTADGGLGSAFADIESLAVECRFRDCEHDAEPECAVRAAVAAGMLDAERLASWHKLRRELAALALRQDKAAAAAARGQVKSAMKALQNRVREKYDR